MACLDFLEETNDLLRPLLGSNAFEVCSTKKIQEFGFSPKHIESIISNNFEGQLDTGKMMSSLLRHVRSLGVEVLNGAEVIDFEEKNDFIQIHVQPSLSSSRIVFNATKIAVCTNAFTSKLLDSILLELGRGQVLITKPIEHLPFKGIFRFYKGFYYFQNVGNRVLFGGGRNLNIKGKTSLELKNTSLIINDLKEKLRGVILPNTPFEVDMHWAGIMAFGQDKSPILSYWGTKKRMVLGVRLGAWE